MTVGQLGQAIKARRQQLRLNQEAFAERAGVSLRILSGIECGNGNPTFQTLDCIAAAFGIQLEELMQPDAAADPPPQNALSRYQPMLEALPPPARGAVVASLEGAIVRMHKAAPESGPDSG